MSSSSLKVACLGAGYFSQFHFESWRRMDEVTLVGVCDTDRARAEANGAPAFVDMTTLLDATTPDIVDIIVPPPFHAEAIRTALRAGVKWIICQKPFCTDMDEARAILAEADAAGARLIVHESFRFQPWYRAIKAELEAGRIGTVLNATFRLRPGDCQGPRAYLDRQPYFQKMPRFLVHETAVHWVDTFRFLFGDATAVYADLRRINPVIAGEDAGHILFDHPNGLRAVFDGNRHLDHAATNPRKTMGEALIEGTLGTLELTGTGEVLLRRFGSLEGEGILGPDTSAGFGGDCVHHLQSHVVSAILDGNAPENTAAAYLPVMQIVEAIYASAERGQKIHLTQSLTEAGAT